MIEGRGDIHHIFPKNYLQNNGKNNRTIYNQIANFAMLQSEINIKISNKAPNVYMKDVINQCNGANHMYGAIDNIEDLKKNMEENCIPEIFINMTVNDYEEFLRQRRILMAKKIKDYYYSL